jgi:hypothetical protein
LPSTDIPTSIFYHTFFGRQLLVITCVHSFYIYSERANELLHHHRIPEKEGNLEDAENFFIGSCVG